MSEIDTGHYRGESLAASVNALSEPEIHLPDDNWGLGDLLGRIKDLALGAAEMLGLAALARKILKKKPPPVPGKTSKDRKPTGGREGTAPERENPMTEVDKETGAAAGKEAGPLAKTGELLKGVGRAAGKWLGRLGVGFVAYDAFRDGKEAMDAHAQGRDIEASGKALSGATKLGALLATEVVSVEAGAAVGSAIFPGPGSLIGGVLGGLAGGAIMVGADRVADGVKERAARLQAERDRRLDRIAEKGGDPARDLVARFREAKDRTAGEPNAPADDRTRDRILGRVEEARVRDR